MITPEHIHDALTLLPEELLTPVDALRRRKRFRWQPIAAAAACLCLIAGLWLLVPAGIKADSGSCAEDGCEVGNSMSGLQTCDLVVDAVYEDYVMAYMFTEIPQPPNVDGIIVQRTLIRVNLEDLAVIPELAAQQQILIYYSEFNEDGLSVDPYKIEIIEN